MTEQTTGGTSKMEMIATRVVQHQANVCKVVMDGIKENIVELTHKVDELTKTVTPLVTDIAVLKSRWQIFGIIGAVIGALGTITGILIAIFD